LVNRVGSTTTDKNVDKLAIAASLKLSFEGSIKISGEASVDYKNQELMGKLESNFDFHAKGGDPAVGGMLAQAQATRGAGLHEAFALWLASVKVVPSVYGLKLEPIYNLFLSLPPSKDVDARVLALKQGVDVYVRETVDPTSTIVLVQPNQALFSNFWRLKDTCLTFQAVIGAGNTFNIYLTTSVSRLDIGYRVDMDQFGSKIYKSNKLLIGITCTRRTSYATTQSRGISCLAATIALCFRTRTPIQQSRSFLDSTPVGQSRPQSRRCD
jgi:hypothetical protein